MVGMQNGAVIMEHSMVVPQKKKKIKHRITVRKKKITSVLHFLILSQSINHITLACATDRVLWLPKFTVSPESYR